MTGEPRRGRRPGDPSVTRAAILEAARTVFAASGYEQATIRAIAAEAAVDPALVHHHFGSKEDLFVTAHEFPFSPSLVGEALAGSEGTIGERLARTYLHNVLDGDLILALVRSAVSNEVAQTMLREFIEEAILDAFERFVDGPDARLRMALAGAQLVGIVMLRRIVGIEVLVNAEIDRIIEVVAPAIDLHLGPVRDEAMPGPGRGAEWR